MALSPHERLLVADDDGIARMVLVAQLQQEGFQVIEACDGIEALERCVSERPALAILDVRMPRLGGLGVIARLRNLGNNIPVLVVSVRAGVEERVQALNSGADDYLPKPYDRDELLARVRALLRRRARQETRDPLTELQLGDTRVDFIRRTVTQAGKVLGLSRIEWAILELLANSGGRPVGREEMFQLVWGYTQLPHTRTVDTHIWRLRKKLGDAGRESRWLKHVGGAGYVLEQETPAPAAVEPQPGL